MNTTSAYTNVHWHILGAGSLGCLWAAYFARAGLPCTLLVKNQQRLDEYQKTNTLQLQTDGLIEHFAVSVRSINQIVKPVSHLIVTTKAHQSLAGVNSIKTQLSDDCTLLIIQNGMRAQLQIAEQFAEQTVLAGVTTDGAYCPQPFHVKHAGIGKTFIGELGSKLDKRQLSAVIATLPGEQLTLEAEVNISQRLWQKLAINCAINALTAIYRCPNGQLLTIPQARQELEQLCEEITLIASASGHAGAVKNLLQDVLAVIRTTAANRSSMLQDIENLRKTEIQSLNGYLCELAEKLSIAAPLNRKIVATLTALEQSLNCQ